MKMAMKMAKLNKVDVVIAHAPGTKLGDTSELQAIENVCGKIPVFSTKHATGHTYGASAGLSLIAAKMCLEKQSLPKIPYLDLPNLKKIDTVMVNAIGFGANAISIILSKV